MDVNAIKRRFLAINRERLRRAQFALRERQRDFLELLPLLFHINNPSLPGFVSNGTPVGVADYSPSARTLEAAKKIDRGHNYKRRALNRYDIMSIFLMGSSGTVAHSRKSDFDIWVCHFPGVAPALLDELRQKALTIERWAAGLDLEVHFFLMTPEVFHGDKQINLTSESSGSAQHYLLLEEFYRTGLLVAGRYPAWWLVPPEEEGRYSAYLTDLRKRNVVRETEYIDFGAVAQVPAEEFLGAAVWQLFKGVDSPYKSVLKLLLMETYANEYPASELLCQRFKRAIYAGELDINRLDPYIMLYEKIEAHLTRTDRSDRLEMARRAFYFKINERLSVSDRRQYNWRRDIMQKLTQNWGWDQTYLELLDARGTWNIHRVIRERKVLASELTQSYQFLSDFAREHAQLSTISTRDLTILGRKLYAAFERKPGKVEVVNRGISLRAHETHLTFHEFSAHNSGQDAWALYLAPLHVAEAGALAPIKRAASVVELLAWCHFNELIDGDSVIAMHSNDGNMSARDLRVLINCLQRQFPVCQVLETDMDDLAQPPRLVSAALFINLGAAPMAAHTRMGVHLTTNKTDALSYGGIGENLALAFDLVQMTSWKEVLTVRHMGVHGLLTCIAQYMQWFPPSAQRPPPPMLMYCLSASYGHSISRRIEELFHGVVEAFYGAAGTNTHYVLEASHAFYVLWLEDDALKFRRVDALADLGRVLAQVGSEYTHTVFDRYAVHCAPLPKIFSMNSPGVVQVFYQTSSSVVDVYCLDERGALYQQRMPTMDHATLIAQYSHFLSNVARHIKVALGIAGIQGIEFYQILKGAQGEPVLARRPGNSAGHLSPWQTLRVVLDDDGRGGAQYTVYCGERCFAREEYGNRLFDEAAIYMVTLAPNAAMQPWCITDLEFGGAQRMENTHATYYLNHKKLLEARLQTAHEAATHTVS